MGEASCDRDDGARDERGPRAAPGSGHECLYRETGATGTPDFDDREAACQRYGSTELPGKFLNLAPCGFYIFWRNRKIANCKPQDILAM